MTDIVVYRGKRTIKLDKYAGNLRTFGATYFDVNGATNQGRCPHCEEKSRDGFFYSPLEDSDCFKGYIQPDSNTGKKEYIIIFQCRKCEMEFWLHNANIMLMDIETYNKRIERGE